MVEHLQINTYCSVIAWWEASRKLFLR